MSNMKQLYELVDASIKQGLTPDTLEQIIALTPSQEDNGTLFDIPTTSEYILKRLINACMSTDQEIREFSSQGLSQWLKRVSISPNIEKLIKFIIETSNYKKGSNRKSQSDAFAAGRVLVIRCLHSFLQNNSQIFQSLSDVLKDFRHIEQEAIEACHLICQDKVYKLKFQSISPTTESGRLLYKLLLKIKDPKSERVNLDDLEFVVEKEIQNYPRLSTVLMNVGKYLHSITDSPMQFFRKYANKFLDNDSEKEADIHEIFAVLTMLQGFLEFNEITEDNFNAYFDKKIISVWLEQLRVLNKKMKHLAKCITIKFANSPELAYKAIVDLHEEGVYLDNISSKHPLAQLYKDVGVEHYFQYIYNLCLHSEKITADQVERKEQTQQKKLKKEVERAQEKMQEEEDEEPNENTFYNEFQYFIKLRFAELSNEAICTSIALLLQRYHANEKRKELLYLCVNLFTLICKTVKEKKTKTRKLNKKMIIILSQLDLTLLGLEEERQASFKKAIVWGKKNTIKIRKEDAEETNQTEIDFFNFYHALVFTSLIYPEEIDTCLELHLVYQDFSALCKQPNEEQLSKPQKRVKKEKKEKKEEEEEEETRKKPIHVLTDIFISLMTKPPAFLRKSINNLFGRVVGELDKSDIGNMLTVITTPDAEFIEEI